MKDELKKSTKEKNTALNIVKYKHFISKEYQDKIDNSYMLQNF